MRLLLSSLLLIGAAGLLATGLEGGDKKPEKKEVTLKGKIACGKCELSVDAECATVIVVKNKEKKDIVYYFDPAGHKKFHDDICSAAKPGAVTGTVAEVGKKKVITVKTVTYD